MTRSIIVTVCLILIALSVSSKPPIENRAVLRGADSSILEFPEASITRGAIQISHKTLRYKSKAGILILHNSNGRPTATMSYVAYFKDGEPDSSGRRPVTFLFNGGPGSSSALLHLAAWGPYILDIKDLERSEAPYHLKPNRNTLLNVSDLVFIDAPGTGLGRVVTPDLGGVGRQEDFYGVDQDATAFADFIVQFVTENDRWLSPKYLFGESYGTFRSPIVARLLQKKGINLNGIIQLSQLLVYMNVSRAIKENPGADLNFELLLPSLAATAFLHRQLPDQPTQLSSFLKEVEHFSLTDYALALSKGNGLDSATFNGIAHKLHQYTGLSLALIKKANLRINQSQFSQNLLPNRIAGRLDTRYTGYPFDPLSEDAEYDPVNTYVGAPLAATVNHYLRNVLKLNPEETYKVTGNVQPWNFTRTGGYFKFPNVLNDLAQSMISNPNMKIMVNGGFYDLATPYFQGKYELSHLPIPKSLQNNIEYHYYESGHMVYLNPDSFKALYDNIEKFIESGK